MNLKKVMVIPTAVQARVVGQTEVSCVNIPTKMVRQIHVENLNQDKN